MKPKSAANQHRIKIMTRMKKLANEAKAKMEHEIDQLQVAVDEYDHLLHQPVYQNIYEKRRRSQRVMKRNNESLWFQQGGEREQKQE